jgi:small subunit ribosomal protein S5e
VSPLRRINLGIYLITTGAREASFRNIRSISECLADELLACAAGTNGSYAIRKKEECERAAKSNR